MSPGYEINDLAKEESWRLFRILGEFITGFEELSNIGPAVTIYGSARLFNIDPIYSEVEDISYKLGKLGFAIITGGGGGAMEAANRGAMKAEAISIGLNIQLPKEQNINSYVTKSITFHHFFARKVMLVKYASAFIITPGGLGTLDELTEVLTLMQTHKIKPFPVVLYKSDYWKGLLDWLEKTALSKKFISPEDMDLLRICDTPEDVVEIVQSWYIRHEIIGKRALRQ